MSRMWTWVTIISFLIAFVKFCFLPSLSFALGAERNVNSILDDSSNHPSAVTSSVSALFPRSSSSLSENIGYDSGQIVEFKKSEVLKFNEARESFAPYAPPQLIKKEFKTYLRCVRWARYQGKLFECDSFLGKDGENLRPIVQAVPSALEELEKYQANKRNIYTLAYVGSMGVASLIIGKVLTPPFRSHSGELTVGGVLLTGGGLLLAGVIVYGFTFLNKNESHLYRSIELYNQSKPESPIHLEF